MNNKKMDYRTLGTYIRKRRENLNVSLNEFAIITDTDPAILSRIENLKQNIKLNVLEKISSGFNLTPAKFLTEFENNKF